MSRFTAVILSLLLAPAALTAAELGYDPAGRWSVQHTDGSEFVITLHKDGTAESTFGEGERGAWRVEGETVHVFWTDGWDDIIYRNGPGFRKSAWEPGARRDGDPTNDGPAKKLD